MQASNILSLPPRRRAFYASRSTVAGSSRAARRVGNQAANRPAATSARSRGSTCPRFIKGNMVAVEIADDERRLASSVVRIRLLFDCRSKPFGTFPRSSKVIDYEPQQQAVFVGCPAVKK